MKMPTKAPNSMVLIFFILCLITVLTHVIPAGEFQRAVKNSREIVVPGTYKPVKTNPQGFMAFITAPVKGFVKAGQIIGFVFFVGGVFGIIHKTGAINAALQRVIVQSDKHPALRKAIIPGLMMLFSFAGASFGMSEEVLVFLLMTIPLAKGLGYDTFVGVAIPFIGAGAGFAGAFSNPFTVGIAQGIADVDIFSGWAYRIVVWCVLTLISIIFVMMYARKVKKASHGLSETGQLTMEGGPNYKWNSRNKIILLLLLFTLVILILGVTLWEWYIHEISGLFIAFGIISALLSRMKTEDIAQSFFAGAKDMLGAILIIALAQSILVIVTDGRIIDTILYAVAYLADGLPPAVSIQVMFFVQGAINFFVPSGSGQAALTMPLMAPLSDLLQISRQSAVLAFQLGDGLFNLIIPTSGVTMGVLSIAKIPFTKWLKWIAPLMILYIIASMILLLLPVVFFSWY